VSLPSNQITPEPVIGEFLRPNDTPYKPLFHSTMGGIKIGDASEGRSVKVWTAYYEKGSIIVKPNAEPIAFTMAVKNVLSLAIAFDQAMTLVLCWTTYGGALLYYFDTITSKYITRTFQNIDSCRVAADNTTDYYASKSDIIFSYTIEGTLRYRQQRDRYDKEYIVAVTDKIVTRTGPTKNNRFQFELKTPEGTVHQYINDVHTIKRGITRSFVAKKNFVHEDKFIDNVVLDVDPVGVPGSAFIEDKSSSKNKIRIPVDYVTTYVTMPSSSQWSSITYGSNSFVAISANNNIVAKSPDGTNWTSVTTLASVSNNFITYENSLFIIVKNLADNSVVLNTSVYGTNWEEKSILPGNWISIAFGSGIYVALASDLNHIHTSLDLITWNTSFDLNTTSPVKWKTVKYLNNLFIAIDWDFNSYTSEDGITWITGGQIGNTLAYGEGVFVSVKSNTNIAYSSIDGINWTQREMPSVSNWISTVYGNKLFFTISSGSSVTAVSFDGVNWSQQNHLSSAIHSEIAFGQGNFVFAIKNSNQSILIKNFTLNAVINTNSQFKSKSIYLRSNNKLIPYIDHSESLDLYDIKYWTLESFFYLKSTTDGVIIFDKDGVSNISQPQYFLKVHPVTGVSLITGAGDSLSNTLRQELIYNKPISINKWHHVAGVRNKSTLKIFLDGVEVASSVYKQIMRSGNTSLYFGAQAGTTTAFDSYVENMRITKDVARYTSHFEVASHPNLPRVSYLVQVYAKGAIPYRESYTLTTDRDNIDEGQSIVYTLTTKYVSNGTILDVFVADTSTAGSIDFEEHASRMTLYLSGKGTNKSTIITDESVKTKTINTVGNVKLSTNRSKSGNSSIYFDGTIGSRLDVTPTNDFILGTKNFTIEGWYYTSPDINNGVLWSIGQYTGASVGTCLYGQLYRSGTTIYLYIAGSTISATNTFIEYAANESIFVNKWVHIALVRYDSVMYLYVNGVKQGNPYTTIRDFIFANRVRIGNMNSLSGVDNFTANYTYNGYIDDFKIIKGVAKYADTRAKVDTIVLDLNAENDGIFDELTDKSDNHYKIIPNNGLTVTNTLFKQGSSSLKINGDSTNNPYIEHNNDLDLYDVSIWSIKFHVYVKNYTTSHAFILDKDGITDVSYPQYRIKLTDLSLTIMLGSGDGLTSVQTFTATWTTSIKLNWVYFSIDRNSNNLKVYKDGIIIIDAAITSVMSGGGQPLYLGAELGQTNTTECWLDNFKIIKSVSTYSAIFTPKSETKQITVLNNTASFALTPTKDLLTEGDETLTIGIRTIGEYPDLVTYSQIGSVNINDTSNLNSIKVFITANKSIVNEFEPVTFTVTTENVYDDTILNYVNSSGLGTFFDVDPFLEFVTLHITGTGVNGNVDIIDSSPLPKLITSSGTVSYTNNKFKSNSSSIRTDTNSCLYVEDTAAVDMGVLDFTIEFYVLPDNLNTNTYISNYGTNAATSGFMIQCINGGTLGAYVYYETSTLSIITSSVVISPYLWQHIAFTRKGNNFYLLVNGVLKATVVSLVTMNNVTTRIRINTENSAGCYYENIRITKGACRYIADFNPNIAYINYNTDFLKNSGEITIVDNTASFTITPEFDFFTEGTENFKMSIYSTYGVWLVTSDLITIRDTSKSLYIHKFPVIAGIDSNALIPRTIEQEFPVITSVAQNALITFVGQDFPVSTGDLSNTITQRLEGMLPLTMGDSSKTIIQRLDTAILPIFLGKPWVEIAISRLAIEKTTTINSSLYPILIEDNLSIMTPVMNSIYSADSLYSDTLNVNNQIVNLVTVENTIVYKTYDINLATSNDTLNITNHLVDSVTIENTIVIKVIDVELSNFSDSLIVTNQIVNLVTIENTIVYIENTIAGDLINISNHTVDTITIENDTQNRIRIYDADITGVIDTLNIGGQIIDSITLIDTGVRNLLLADPSDTLSIPSHLVDSVTVENTIVYKTYDINLATSNDTLFIPSHLVDSITVENTIVIKIIDVELGNFSDTLSMPSHLVDSVTVENTIVYKTYDINLATPVDTLFIPNHLVDSITLQV